MCCRAPNDDYSSASLQTVNDTLFLNLFDEYVIDTEQVRLCWSQSQYFAHNAE